MADVRVIFFDIGDTLAAADFATGRLVLRPLPGVLQVLRRLQDSALRLGLISHTDGETTETMRRALTDAQLYPLFAAEPQLLIYSSEVHMRKDSPRIFQLACERAGLKGHRLGLVLPLDRARRLLALYRCLQALHHHGGGRCHGDAGLGAAGVWPRPGRRT